MLQDDYDDEDEDGYQRPSKKSVKIPDRYLEDYADDKIDDGYDLNKDNDDVNL